MKKNILKAFALVILVAFASCSKDDSSSNNTTTEPDPVALTEEENEEYSIAQADSDENTAEFAEIMESVEIPAFKGNASVYYGPEICGMKPVGILNGATLSYDFTYNFSTDETCDFRGKKVTGKVVISVNASKTVTIKFINFTIKSRESKKVYSITHTMNGSINMPYTTDTSKKYKFEIDSKTTVDYKGNKRDKIRYNEGDLTISNTAESITVNYTALTKLAKVKFTTKASGLKLIKSCREKGFVSGNLTVGNTKNQLKINFGDGTCSNSKWIVTNNGFTSEILLD